MAPLGVPGAGLAGGMRRTQRCPRLWSQPTGRYSNRLTLGASPSSGSSTGAAPWTRGSFSWLLSCSRAIQTTAVCHKNRAARVRVGKGDKPVTYEQAHPPHYIAHRKGWLSLHTSNLDGEGGAAERTVEDVFIRKFIYGTFHGCLANEIVLKRRANVLVVCAVFLQRLPPYKFYFLVGYTETLLSFLYKCPVRLEVQTVPEKVIYKYL
ncbi:28S ribosomal protein S24, mitochondrial isoform X1 [Mauremys reevesii]|uniref:28S ribosomal protein S24, mitochondrial isoform X1 n=1 Tax=Mauremys reevesii TaxID=260615 RepID=UPI00193EF303|nr:28S ribosomal protein S24, mitochondrial isoform X1 [Mauremys reevesii]